MFSRIYKSARALLPITPSVPTPQEFDTPKKMVTPRRSKPVKTREEITDDNRNNVYVSSGSRRRTRQSQGEDVEEVRELVGTPAKRRKLPVRENPKRTVPVVEIPAMRMPSVANSQENPIEIGSEVDEESEFEDSDEDEDEVPAKASESGDMNKDEEGNIEDQEEPVHELPAQSTTKHHKFDSEEPEAEIFSTAREVADEVTESAGSIEDSEDSEDDAPEAVGIQEAAEEIKLKERDAARAAQEQVSASRKKRKERDEVLKKQSSGGKKRKLVIDTSSNPLKASHTPQDPSITPSITPSSPQPKSHLTSRHTLPNFLPAEYLSDSEPQTIIPVSNEQAINKKSKKTKFQDAENKQVKDRRVGKTTYRVVKTTSSKLAPKSAFRARSMKEAWLQGRSGGKSEGTRRAFGKGFGRK